MWAALVVGGIRRTYGLVLVAALVTVLWPDGSIETIGPFTLMPSLRTVVVVPLLLALCPAIGYSWAGATPVLTQSARVVLARLWSYAVILAVGIAILMAGALLAESPVFWASLRNLLWLSGLALATGALAGPAYAWLPLLVAFGAAIVLPQNQDPWGIQGMLLHEAVIGPQVAVAAVILLLGVGLAAADPLRRDRR